MADASSSPSFSGNEKEVMDRKLTFSYDPVNINKDVNDFYEISFCVDAIKRGNFKKVRKM